MAIELFGDAGIVTTIIATVIALWKAIQARNLSGAITAIGKLWNSNNKEVTKTSELPKDAQTVVNANIDAILMTETLKEQILKGLTTARKTEILQIIYDNENDGIPGDSYTFDIAERNQRYEIFAGKIRNISEIDPGAWTATLANIDPGSCEIFRAWGGKFGSAGNVPQKQPDEITMEMTNREVFVSIRTTEIGGVTLGLFIDGVLQLPAKVLQLSSEELDASASNDLAFTTVAFTIPKNTVRDARESDGKFEMSIAWARGGQWYYLTQDPSVTIPWQAGPAITVICPSTES